MFQEDNCFVRTCAPSCVLSSHSDKWAAPGNEPGTSRTRSENHATRPSSLLDSRLANFATEIDTHLYGYESSRLRKLMVITEQKTQPKEKEEERKEEEEVMSLPQFAPTSLYTILGFLNPPHLGFLKYAQKWLESASKMLKFFLRNLIPPKKRMTTPPPPGGQQ